MPDFHRRLLETWESDAASRLSATLADEDKPVAMLRALAQSLTRPSSAEPAIRSWAQSAQDAKRTVARIDEARIEGLHAMLRGAGIRNPEMARILYSAAIGMTQIGEAGPSDSEDAIGSLVDLILALR